MTRILHTARINNVESVMFVDRNNSLQTLRFRHCWSEQYAGCVSYKLRNRPRSPWSLCGSVVRASECGMRRSEVRFLMRTQDFFFVPRSWQDENIFLCLSGIYTLHFRIRRSEVRFLMGTQNFFFVPRSWQEENIFLCLSAPLFLSKILGGVSGRFVPSQSRRFVRNEWRLFTRSRVRYFE